MNTSERAEGQGERETPYLESKISISDYSMDRRTFLKCLGLGVGVMGIGTSLVGWGLSNQTATYFKREAYDDLYKKNTLLEEDDKVKAKIGEVLNEELDMPSPGWSTVHGISTFAGFGMTLLGGWFLSFVNSRRKPHKNRRAVKVERRAPGLPVDYSRARFYMPPVGGKVISSEDDNLWYIFPPTLRAEEQVAIVNGLQSEVDLGPFYIHQLSVQGRLKDPFKYAALALILDNPFPNDWTTPLYDADWGRVAPLVHDGGFMTYFNNYWQVRGRTDFLQRVSPTNLKESLDLLKLSPIERSELSKTELFKALFFRNEQERLLLESRFYQRIGLARHCRETGSFILPDQGIRALLAWEWDGFEKYMRSLANELGATRFDSTPWFLDTTRDIWKEFPGRYEADWPPIQELLIKIEEERQKRPELAMQMRKYLSEVTDRIDKILGIKTD